MSTYQSTELERLAAISADAPDIAMWYARDGVVVVSDVLSRDWVDDIRRNVERYRRFMIASVPQDWVRREADGTVSGMYFMERVDPYFAELRANPHLTGLIERVTGLAATPMGVETFDKPAFVGSASLPHQDGIYFAETTTRIVHIWLPLDDVTAGNGGMRYWPGSHHAGIRTHVPTADPWLVQLSAEEVASLPPPKVAELPTGSVIVHHDRVVHASPENPSPFPRRAVAISWSLALES